MHFYLWSVSVKVLTYPCMCWCVHTRLYCSGYQLLKTPCKGYR
jgi:hypothetical protein